MDDKASVGDVIIIVLVVIFCVGMLQSCTADSGRDPDSGNPHEECYDDGMGHKQCTYH